MTSTLGSRVSAQRKKLKLTQRELARRLDCTTATLCNIERDRVKNPSARVLLALSKHLRKSTQTLLGGGRG